jgi:hydrogenase maturation protease
MSNPKKRLIIGIGNEYRSDDAVGFHIARKIAALSLPFLEVVEESGEGTSLMEAWKNHRSVILIDSVRSGSAPGTLHRIEAHKRPLPIHISAYSSHAFGAAEAIELARTLHQLPQQVIVYGIEGRNFSAGTTLSFEVQQAAAQTTKSILDEARESSVPGSVL